MGHSQGRSRDADSEKVLGSVVVLHCSVDHASVIVVEKEVLHVVASTLQRKWVLVIPESITIIGSNSISNIYVKFGHIKYQLSHKTGFYTSFSNIIKYYHCLFSHCIIMQNQMCSYLKKFIELKNIYIQINKQKSLSLMVTIQSKTHHSQSSCNISISWRSTGIICYLTSLLISIMSTSMNLSAGLKHLETRHKWTRCAWIEVRCSGDSWVLRMAVLRTSMPRIAQFPATRRSA